LPISLGNLEIILLFFLSLALAIIVFLGRKYYVLRHESKNQLDSILNEIQDGVYRADLNGNLVWVSPSAMKILGVESREDIIGTNIKELYVYPERRAELITKLKQDDRAENFEALLRRMDGSHIVVSANVLYWRDSDGNIRGITGVFRDITEQKRAEAARIESEIRFTEALKNSRDILYRLNLKTNTYDYMSNAVFDITGFTSEEMIEIGPDGLNELVHPEDKDLQVDYRYKLIESDKGDQATYYTESRIKGKNGQYIWSGDSHALVRDANGEPQYIIGCARDITRQKQIEQALQQSELLNRTTIDTIDEAIHVIDLDMKIILMNKAFQQWCENLDISLDFIGKSIFELFPFLSEKVREEYQQVINTGGIVITEETSLVDGQTIITDTRKIPVMDDGKITRIVTIIRDITIQKQAEAARIESEVRFHEALENSRDILYRLNLETNRYDYMSTSVFDLTGYTRDEVLAVEADGINTITHPDDLKITENYRKRLIEADRGKKVAHTIEYRIQHKDGHYIWLGDSHTLIMDSRGESFYIIGVVRDITEQKLSEIRHKARINLLDKLRKADSIDACLDYGCRAIFEAHLFERAVLTMHNDKKEIINIGYVGLDIEIIKAARNAPAPGDELLKKMTQEQFRISNSYFIPAESGILYVKTERFVAQKDFTNLTYSTWRPGDELFVPIKGEAEMYEGWLSVDTPFDRKRPTQDVITLLEETVDIVTQKIREIRAQNILNEKHNALTESEEKYRNLIDSNPDPIFIFQNDKIKLVNPAFIKLLGYDLEEINQGNGFLKIIEKNDVEAVLRRMKDRQSGNALSNIFSIDLISKDGRKIPCDTSVSSVQYLDRPAIFITIRDITERKKMVDALLQSEAFSKAIIKYSPIGVSVRSNTGKLLSANDAWVKIWGHTEEEMIDFGTREKDELKFDYCDEYLGRWIPALERIYKEGGYLHVPDVQVTDPKRKGPLYVSQHFYAIKDTSGNVDRVVILTEDITERKNTEQKIKLIDSEKLNQAKRIAGTFAHEIRNALFPASASLNRLKRFSLTTNNSEDLKKYSSIAERSITRAADITGLISSYTKLETELMPERVKLNEIFEELVNSNQLRLKENYVQVNLSGGNNCLVKSNRRQLLLAFNNLLLNSIDALAHKEDRNEGNEKDNRKINISWSCDGEGCNITFQDTGGGIPAEYQDRIFEPFFSKKSESGGTGLGLATAKRIIEMYDGSISVSSKLSTGTVFNINLKNYKDNFGNKLE